MQNTLLKIGLVVVILWAISTALTPHAAQAAPTFTCSSTAGSGNWNNAATWTGCNSTIPQNGDNVVIAATSTVLVDTPTNSIASLTVNGQLQFNQTTGRTVTVTGDVTIGTTGSIVATNVSSSTNNSINVSGNFTNNGVFTAVSLTAKV